MNAHHLRCEVCCWRGTVDEILRAPNPFDADDVLFACPDCKSVGECTTMCDEPGCDKVAGCGWPAPDGYRWTCGKHNKWQENEP